MPKNFRLPIHCLEVSPHGFKFCTKCSRSAVTAVARMLDDPKKPVQRVQAVDLGRTDRFPERNPISEFWQIVPKSN